jgi:GDP-L-fucose synthase
VFKQMRVLVAGGTGMIGRQLVDLLIQQGARVKVASLDDASRAHPEAEFVRANVMSFEACLEICRGMDYVFNLVGVKGSPAVTTVRPASFFVPTLTMDTNLMEAARKEGAGGYLFTSSVGVYHPDEILHEDAVWKTFPSEHDRFAGWAKRMGELQADAYRIEYGWKRISIVRPSNVYGPFDNFDPPNSMVVPSLIRRVLDGESPLKVWGDGSAERDFIHARDVARGMILAAEKGMEQPINLGSGVGVTVRQLVEIIVRNVDPGREVVWDTSKPTGDRKRIMDMGRARAMGFAPSISLESGIREVIDWYRDHRDRIPKRFDVFTA